MYHLLKQCRINGNVYQTLWKEGYTFDTIKTIPRQRWESFGVSPGSIENLDQRMGGLRQDRVQTMVAADGTVTSVQTGNYNPIPPRL